MPASKLIIFLATLHPSDSSPSSPPDNITLTSANRKADQNLSDFQTDVGVAAHATLEREQIISYLRAAHVDTLSSLPDLEGGIIPVSEVHDLLQGS